MGKMNLLLFNTVVMGLLTILTLISILTTKVDVVSRHYGIHPHGERFELFAEAYIYTKGIYSIKSAEFTIQIYDASGEVKKTVTRKIKNTGYVEYYEHTYLSKLGFRSRDININLTKIRFNYALPIVFTVLAFIGTCSFLFLFLKEKKLRQASPIIRKQS